MVTTPTLFDGRARQHALARLDECFGLFDLVTADLLSNNAGGLTDRLHPRASLELCSCGRE
jgi:hypothetical protein